MDEELPRANIKRLVKTKLSTLDNIDSKGVTFEPTVQKDALHAYGECAKIFIHYLTATANEVCRDHKRSTISAEDVLAAIEECDFEELKDEVRATLHQFQTNKRAKKTSDEKERGDDDGKDDRDGDGDDKDLGDDKDDKDADADAEE